MKINKLIFFIFLTLLIFTQGKAQNDDSSRTIQTNRLQSKRNSRIIPDAKNCIKLNLLSPFYNNLNATFQQVINDENSIQIGASYMDFNGLFGASSHDNELTNMFTLTPEYRYNLNGRNLSGAYFGAFARYINMNYSFDQTDQIYSGPPSYTYTSITTHKSYSYSTLGIGMLIGAQTIYKRKIVFDSFIGPVYSILLSSSNVVHNNNDINTSDNISTLFLRGYGIRAGFNVGFIF